MSFPVNMTIEDSKQQLSMVQYYQKNPDKVLESLQKLCISLVMGIEIYLRGFDAAIAIPLLLRMSERESFTFCGDTLTMIFRALSLIMEYVPSSYNIICQYHKRLIKSVCKILTHAFSGRIKYENMDNIMLLEESLRIIRFVSKDENHIFILRFGITNIIRLCLSESTLLARQAFDVFPVICSKIILPSESEKLSIFYQLPFLKKWRKKNKKKEKEEKDKIKNNKEDSTLSTCEEPTVTTIETVITPFLQTALQQYSTTLQSFPEAWTFLEIIIQCFGMIIQRCMLCKRISTIYKLVTQELCHTLFRLMLFIETNVTFDHNIRSYRLLLCETTLGVAIAANCNVAIESLLTKEAQSFYKFLFEEQNMGITTQLDDPFPRTGTSSRGSHQRDKDSIVSISAIWLFVVACPRIPGKAFGPKPKVLLPVHQWMWEDEMRHNNNITEEGCIALESCSARLGKELMLRVHSKIMTVDLQTMKMSNGFGGMERNVFRKCVPFVFHFVDEMNVYSSKSTRTKINLKLSKQRTQDITVLNVLEAKAKLFGLETFFVMNKDETVSSMAIDIAEMYLEGVCSFVIWASGQSALQLGTCACASLLQAAICSGYEQRLGDLLCRIMRPLCEMLRQALVSTDKVVKSLALTMMVWLLCHPRVSDWKFTETAQRCGVVYQLEVLSYSDSKKQIVKEKTKKTASKSHFEVYQTRTEHLAALALALRRVISEELTNLNLSQGPSSLCVVDVTSVSKAVKDLKALACISGVHREAVGNVLNIMEKSINSVTTFEISKLGIADAILHYLLAENYISNNSNMVVEKEDAATAEAIKNEFSVKGFLPGNTEDLLSFGGTRTANGLLQRCHKERLECFMKCVEKSPRGVEALIEHLLSALPLQSNLPLVESLLYPGRVLCRPPAGAAMACAQISPVVSICSKEDSFDPASNISIARKNSKSTNKRESLSPEMRTFQTESKSVADNGESNVNLRDYCPQGHKLCSTTKPNLMILCDLCEEEVNTGFCCLPCRFYLCSMCYTNPESHYKGGMPLPSPKINPEDGAPPVDGFTQEQQEQKQKLSQVFKPLVRAHLFASMGDIERYFRTGSCSTKNTDVAPAPQSVLQNIDFFVARAQSFLSRKQIHCSYAVVRQEVCRILNSFSVRGPIPDPGTVTCREAEGLLLGSKEQHELNSILRDAIEERYILYTTHGGRCSYQETLIGNLLQHALQHGALGVVEQLENCLLSIEGSAGASFISISDISSNELPFTMRNDTAPSTGATDFPGWVSNVRTCMFHHFESDENKYCSCGNTSRIDLNTFCLPRFVRKPSHLYQNRDALLLIILHKLLNPLIKKGSINADTTVFVSAPLASLVVKSLAASALRVALLPPRLAVPRWVDFIITEASFFLPLNVRERIARFIAYGARRKLHGFLKTSPLSRLNRAIKIYPAEWGRLANHRYRVNRETLLRDAYKVLQKSADSRFPISIEFEGDVGVGQGPTAHFYTLIAEEVKKAQLNLWRCSKHVASGKNSEKKVIPPLEGLYPRISSANERRLMWHETPQRVPQERKLVTEQIVSMYDFAEFDRERAQCYYLLGAALGRAFTDEVVFPLDLSPALAIFLRRGVPPPRVFIEDNVNVEKGVERPVDLMELSLDDVELMDQSIAKSVRLLHSLNASTLASMAIPFTLPGDDSFELKTGGTNMCVTASNVATYTFRTASALLYDSSVLPIHFMARGFHDIVPCDALASLNAQETMSLLCGCRVGDSNALWTASEIKSILVADHGYQNNSPQMAMLLNILANRLTPSEQRAFLLFCTGCPRLPAGGVESLGAITVVRRSDFRMFGGIYDTTLLQQQDSMPLGDHNALLGEAAWPLPTVNTCFRYLKLPPYPTEELMYKKLLLGITQGVETFQLS